MRGAEHTSLATSCKKNNVGLRACSVDSPQAVATRRLSTRMPVPLDAKSSFPLNFNDNYVKYIYYGSSNPRGDLSLFALFFFTLFLYVLSRNHFPKGTVCLSLSCGKKKENRVERLVIRVYRFLSNSLCHVGL